jgi:hypothetical protein
VSDQEFKFNIGDKVLFDPRVGETRNRSVAGVILARRVGVAGVYYEIRRTSNGCVYAKIESGVKLVRGDAGGPRD